MAEALLGLDKIIVAHGEKTILEVPSLTVFPGEVLAIIGPNGAGKSTLLRVMGLLERPTSGRVCFHGDEPDNCLSARRRMATVFHEPLLLNASVYENAALGLKLRGFKRRVIEQRVRPWLEHLGIAHLTNRPARSLSGGEAQRTSLVRALALDPELLLLDEPFSSLDPPTREELLGDLDRILRDTGMATVFVTHDRNEAANLANRVGVLIGGKLLQIGPAAEIFTRPSTEEVARFVGVEIRIRGIVEKALSGTARIRFDGGTVEVAGDLQPGEPVLVCLRPEDVILTEPGTENLTSNGVNHVTGRIAKITSCGFHSRVTLDCNGNPLVAFISGRSSLDSGLREGNDVVASFKTEALHVIKSGKG